MIFDTNVIDYTTAVRCIYIDYSESIFVRNVKSNIIMNY